MQNKDRGSASCSYSKVRKTKLDREALSPRGHIVHVPVGGCFRVGTDKDVGSVNDAGRKSGLIG